MCHLVVRTVLYVSRVRSGPGVKCVGVGADWDIHHYNTSARTLLGLGLNVKESITTDYHQLLVCSNALTWGFRWGRVHSEDANNPVPAHASVRWWALNISDGAEILSIPAFPVRLWSVMVIQQFSTHHRLLRGRTVKYIIRIYLHIYNNRLSILYYIYIYRLSISI